MKVRASYGHVWMTVTGRWGAVSKTRFKTFDKLADAKAFVEANT